MEKPQEIDLKKFVKGQASMKDTNLTNIAEKIGKRQSTLSGILIRKTMTVDTLIDVLDALDEKLIIVLSNGNRYKIEL